MKTLREFVSTLTISSSWNSRHRSAATFASESSIRNPEKVVFQKVVFKGHKIEQYMVHLANNLPCHRTDPTHPKTSTTRCSCDVAFSDERKLNISWKGIVVSCFLVQGKDVELEEDA